MEEGEDRLNYSTEGHACRREFCLYLYLWVEWGWDQGLFVSKFLEDMWFFISDSGMVCLNAEACGQGTIFHQVLIEPAR